MFVAAFCSCNRFTLWGNRGKQNTVPTMKFYVMVFQTWRPQTIRTCSYFFAQDSETSRPDRAAPTEHDTSCSPCSAWKNGPWPGAMFSFGTASTPKALNRPKNGSMHTHTLFSSMSWKNWRLNIFINAFIFHRSGTKISLILQPNTLGLDRADHHQGCHLLRLKVLVLEFFQDLGKIPSWHDSSPRPLPIVCKAWKEKAHPQKIKGLCLSGRGRQSTDVPMQPRGGWGCQTRGRVGCRHGHAHCGDQQEASANCEKNGVHS